MILALGGNQNCGKTTLFNRLTGSNQHVGNFPGVTVESKSGIIKNHENVEVVDLPGIYSLSPYSNEEIVTRDFLTKGKPDGIINIIDATNIERNLYLSLQIMELKIPMVIALNMMDEVRAAGNTIKIKELSELLGVPVIPITASKNEGIEQLIETVMEVASKKQRPKRVDFCSGAVHRTIHGIAHMIEDHAENAGINPRFAATKLIEGDEPIAKELKLTENELEMIEHSVTEMESELKTDREAAMADMRYTFIEGVCSRTVIKNGDGESPAYKRSVAIDRFLTHKYLAIPIFLGFMVITFWLTFGIVGNTLCDLLDSLIGIITAAVDNALTIYGINEVVHSLVIDAIFTGVGSVLSFLPRIIVLFFCLSLMEDSGYMARVAFVMDKLLRKIGLSGRSFVPLIIGFGCTVPAIMATRTLSSERDRKMTILLTPFMSCSAKLPIYTVLAGAFFERPIIAILLLYIGGIFVGILTGILFKGTLFRGNPVPFVMELPNYRFPSLKSVGLLLWEKAKDFITRAFTVIFVATIVVWFLTTFDSRLNVVSDNSLSILASLGRIIAPVLKPVGFGDWRAATALITGFTAKETVVSTLSILLGASEAGMASALASVFSPLSAAAFLTFALLYTPCFASVAVIRRELNNRLATAGVICYQIAVAWIAAFLVYNIGGMFL